jgi:glycosyltransferase involved in cell wall biosynthesis
MGTAREDVTYSIVVPVFNSESTLPQLYERLVAVMEGFGEPFEMVLVENCGTDGSWAILRTLAELDERVLALQRLRSFGQASATIYGLRHARDS